MTIKLTLTVTSFAETEGLVKTPNLAVSRLQKDVTPPRPESIGSGSNASTSGSQSSFSSGRGSLSPSGLHGNQVHGLYGTSETLSGDSHQSQSHLTSASLLYILILDSRF